MSTFIHGRSVWEPRWAEFDADLSQVAGSYDLAAASDSLLVDAISLYVVTAGTVFDSVAFASDQTTAFEILSAADGALANITAERSLPSTWTQGQPFRLESGDKIRYTIAGAQGTGLIRAAIRYIPLVGGAELS